MKRILMLWCAVAFFGSADGQIITTYAGNGSTAHTGDGGLATAASIGEPTAVAVDAQGNFYIGDVLGNVVRKVTPCGIISTVAGTGSAGYNGDNIPATSAELHWPTGIAFDSLDNIYIAELLNNRVRKVDVATGIISTVAGNGILGIGSDGGFATATALKNPNNICFDRYGNLYITDGSNRIRKVDTFGIISTVVGTGMPGYTGDGGLATAAEIEDLYGVCTDTIGNLYFDQQDYNMVRKVDTAGIITTIAGDSTTVPSGDGGPAMYAGLGGFGLTFDRFGNLYIGGGEYNDVRKINSSGIIYTVAGNDTAGFSGDGGSADSAELNNVRGVAVDPYGNLYIADFDNHRIRKVTFNPVVIPTIIITASMGDTTYSGTPVTFTATVTGDSTPVYQWLVNGNVVGTDSTYTYTPANGDSVRCVLSVPGLCTSPSSNTIYMVVKSLTVPVIGFSAHTVNIYPNPAYNTITIAASTTIKSVTIRNLVGQIVYTQQYNSEKVQVNVENLPVGIYFVKVNEVWVQKVVKE